MRTTWRLLFGLLAAAQPALAQTPPRVSVSVDANGARTRLARVWAFHGYDEINYTTTPEGQALLGTMAKAHTAPLYVRSHFLFNTGDGTPARKWGSTNVYTEDADGNAVYSWTLTDSILDTLLAAGGLPFVELGFMPEALSIRPVPYQNTSTTALDGGCFYPPKDYEKWADLVRTWAEHASERNPASVDRWLWELWNEPDIGYWRGTPADYAELYDYTEAALHEALPNAALGGPAVARPDTDFLREFLEHCANGANAVSGETGTRLDHVTFHAKGGVSMVDGHIRMDLGNQLRLHRAGFDTIKAFPSFEGTPVYITEADPDGCAACPPSVRPENAYRNSTAYGAYELAMMKHSLDLADEVGVDLAGVLTWAFTFPGTPYFAGYRTLATNGIDLPVLGAFRLLGSLSGERVPVQSSGAAALDDILSNGVGASPDIDGMAALDGSTLRILLWNYHDDLVPVASSPVHLSVRLPAEFAPGVRVSHLRVDENHGNAYGIWVAQGSPQYPTEAEVLALKEAMEPSSLLPDATLLPSKDGSLDLDFDLPRFGVSLLTLEAERSPTAGGSGGAGGESPSEPDSGCACTIGLRETSRGASLGIACAALALLARRRQSTKVNAGSRV